MNKLQRLLALAREALDAGDMEKAEQLTAQARLLQQIDSLEPAAPAPAVAAEPVAKTTDAPDVGELVRTAVREELTAARKAAKETGVLVTADETDKQVAAKAAFTSFGDFLIAVARATDAGPLDKRLAAIKSENAADEGGFDVVAAMGGDFVGGFVKAQKAASGMSETVPSAGGYLVQTDRMSGIMSKVYNTGELLRRADMVPLSTNANGMTFYAEDETSRANGSRKGGIRAYWRAEAATVTSTQPKFREMKLDLNSLLALVYATDELLSDAAALETWVMNNLPDEIRFVAENAIMNGSGTGQPLGFMNSAALISVAKESGQAASTVVSENIWNMFARMWAPSIPRAVWFISQDVWPQLFQLSLAVGTGGSALFQPPGGISVAPYGSLMGRPVVPIEYCAALGTVGDIVFADIGEYQMIEKGGIAQATSMHVRFIYGENTYRFTYRVDGQPKWDAPLTPYNGGNTQSPFVALATRS